MATEPAPTATIRHVLRQPGVGVAFLLSLLARMPATATGALIALRLGPEHGYAVAGVVDAVFAVALAVAMPIWGRVLERLGPTRVLALQSVANMVALGLFGLVPAETSPWVFALIAIAAGTTEPIHGGAMRALWDRLLATPEERHIGYALDSAALEALFAVATGLFVGVAAAAGGAGAGLVAIGAVTGVAGVWFAVLPAVRAWRPEPESVDGGGVLGALRQPGARLIVAVSFSAGLHLGPVELGITAFGQAEGSVGSVGVLLAVWGIGSMLGGLAMTRVPPSPDPARRMALLLLWVAATSASLLLVHSILAAAVVMFVVGSGLAPFFATLNGSFEHLAPGEKVTELFGLTFSGMLVGATLGSPIAGLAIDHVSAKAGIAVAGIGPLLGAVLLLSARRGRPADTRA